jgi:multidrug efflux pump subunit AcrA (membrane-fusion protein)
MADPASRSFTVKVNLPAQAQLRSGMFGRARFSTGERTALFVSSDAILVRGQLEAVYVVDEAGRARFRLITTGRRIDDKIEVLSGLNGGERIVRKPSTQLLDGTPLKVSQGCLSPLPSQSREDERLSHGV